MRFSSVAIILLMCGGANASAYDEAVQKAVLAAVKQSGLDVMIQDCIKREVPKGIRDLGDKLIPVIRIGIDQRVDLQWNY